MAESLPSPFISYHWSFLAADFLSPQHLSHLSQLSHSSFLPSSTLLDVFTHGQLCWNREDCRDLPRDARSVSQAPPYISSKRQTSQSNKPKPQIAYIPPFVTEEDDITVATCNYHSTNPLIHPIFASLSLLTSLKLPVKRQQTARPTVFFFDDEIDR